MRTPMEEENLVGEGSRPPRGGAGGFRGFMVKGNYVELPPLCYLYFVPDDIGLIQHYLLPKITNGGGALPCCGFVVDADVYSSHPSNLVDADNAYFFTRMPTTRRVADGSGTWTSSKLKPVVRDDGVTIVGSKRYLSFTEAGATTSSGWVMDEYRVNPDLLLGVDGGGIRRRRCGPPPKKRKKTTPDEEQQPTPTEWILCWIRKNPAMKADSKKKKKKKKKIPQRREFQKSVKLAVEHHQEGIDPEIQQLQERPLKGLRAAAIPEAAAPLQAGHEYSAMEAAKQINDLEDEVRRCCRD